MVIKEKNGYVLITVLLMLLVLTVVGLAAIGTSTVENLLSGNIRLKERNMAEADGCAELSTALIERAVRESDTFGFAGIVSDPNIAAELGSTPFPTDPSPSDPLWDMTCSAAGQAVNVDIDMMYSKWIGGSSIEFASGYEGMGKGGSSGVEVYYRINASGSGLMSSSFSIGNLYRYIPK